MEVPYILAILNTIIAGMYVYAHLAFNYADKGVDFLSALAFKQTQKLNNDPLTLNAIRNRDLPNVQNFALQRNRVKSLLAITIIINLVNYVMYPYDGLLYSWMQYILIGASAVTSFDTILIFFNLRRNKGIVNIICTAYDDLTIKNAQDNQIEKTIISINDAFDDMMKDLNKEFPEVKNKNKNDNDEK